MTPSTMDDPLGRRPAEAGDVGELVRLECALFGRDAWSEAAVADELARVPETRYAVVGTSGGRVVAYAILRCVAETAEIQRLAVAGDHQRRGVGRTLLADLVSEGSRRGCAEVLLEVAASNVPAIGLYASAGFVELMRRRGYYDGGREDAVVMRLDLTTRPRDHEHLPSKSGGKSS